MNNQETEKSSKNVLLEALKKKREKQGLGIFGDSNSKGGKNKSSGKVRNLVSTSSSIGHRPTGR
jgi:hypothetical protein